jgi:hypothetical protein
MSDVMEKPKQLQRAPCAPEHGNPKAPNEARIDVTLTKGCPNPKFTLTSSDLKDYPPGSGNFQFDNKGRPGFNIHFILDDQTGDGYVFAPVPDDACWSQLGSNSCPGKPVYDVFCPRAIGDSGKRLDVYNFNPRGPHPSGGIGPFTYTLRVTKDGGKSYCDLDPGGTDNNGTRS